MKPVFAALFVALIAAPAARAGTIKINAGGELPLFSHDKTSGTQWLTDQTMPALNLRLGYAPIDLISIDVEVSERFWTNAPAGQNSRQGTDVRVGVTIEPPVLPIYLVANVPVHSEPSPFAYGVRAGAGLTFNLLIARLYLEGLVDFPLGGSSTTNGAVTISAPDAFSRQTVSVGGGVQFRF
jgi:hypothetical protein